MYANARFKPFISICIPVCSNVGDAHQIDKSEEIVEGGDRYSEASEFRVWNLKLMYEVGYHR